MLLRFGLRLEKVSRVLGGIRLPGLCFLGRSYHIILVVVLLSPHQPIDIGHSRESTIGLILNHLICILKHDVCLNVYLSKLTFDNFLDTIFNVLVDLVINFQCIFKSSKILKHSFLRSHYSLLLQDIHDFCINPFSLLISFEVLQLA